jgi:hypothetical protein
MTREAKPVSNEPPCAFRWPLNADRARPRSRKYPSACPVASFAMKQASLLSSNRPGRREAVRTSARHLPDGTVVIG